MEQNCELPILHSNLLIQYAKPKKTETHACSCVHVILCVLLFFPLDIFECFVRHVWGLGC